MPRHTIATQLQFAAPVYYALALSRAEDVVKPDESPGYLLRSSGFAFCARTHVNNLHSLFSLHKDPMIACNLVQLYPPARCLSVCGDV